ncbi:MAG: NADPH-dependent F420 reductase [Candidatus Hodarchaeales archaeon]|jgi:NADPH-dependent F420 reductase
MKIGIIGTGNMGMGLAKQFVKNDHEVLIGSRNPEKAKEKLEIFSEKVKVGTVQEVVEFGEVIALAVKFPVIIDVLKTIGPLDGKIILDLTNPVGIKLDKETSAAEEIAKVIPGAKIVKAFNTIFSSIIHSNPEFGDQKATLFYCGNDEEAKNKVAKLAEEMGYEPLDAGSLEMARFTEAMTLFLIHLSSKMKMGSGIAFKLLKR